MKPGFAKNLHVKICQKNIHPPKNAFFLKHTVDGNQKSGINSPVEVGSVSISLQNGPGIFLCMPGRRDMSNEKRAPGSLGWKKGVISYRLL